MSSADPYPLNGHRTIVVEDHILLNTILFVLSAKMLDISCESSASDNSKEVSSLIYYVELFSPLVVTDFAVC